MEDLVQQNGGINSNYRRKMESEEERRLRKLEEHKNKSKSAKRNHETKEKRRLRKENETEEERRIRKEKEKMSRQKHQNRREETAEERLKRKEKEKIRGNETAEERRLRKELEYQRKKEKRRNETEEERRIRKLKEKEKIKIEENSSDFNNENRTLLFSFKEESSNEDDYNEKSENVWSNSGMDIKEEIKEEEEEQQDEEDDEDDDVPLSKKGNNKKRKKNVAKNSEKSVTPAKKRKKSDSKEVIKDNKSSPLKKGSKGDDTTEVWKWWEEESKVDDGTKWKFLEHMGPIFPPEYERLPSYVNFRYNGKPLRLCEASEEVATFYGKMLDHDYTSKEVFNKNFFKDWRKFMTMEEQEIIRDLSKCDFSEINEYYKKLSEERKARSKEERKAEKLNNANLQEELGYCIIDGHREKIGNFRVEPPGLFRGRGEHPKQGAVKTRVMPEDISINCSKDSKFPVPPKGHKWKEIKHDNTVTWLASWQENVQNQTKYVMLNPSSKLKGEKDMMKYEKARELKDKIDKIRLDYEADLKSSEMRIRQRAVALYFIDKLALRAGNEKDEDQADTVGCCSLRVEHIKLIPERDGKEYIVEFDFLGKDSIRYLNAVSVEKRVYKNVKLFMENKKEGDDLFDRLNTTILNEYLNGLMKGLTAKVFRTYNASITLQIQLQELTDPTDNLVNKMLSYNRANRSVAVLCNHQRAVPKTHEKSMGNIQLKIENKKELIEKAEKEYKAAKKAYKSGGSAAEKDAVEKRKKAVERLLEQLSKLEVQAVDREENKTIALGTSKLNYLDPRISTAWCKKHDVPIDKVYNKTQRDKFRWAIEMADADYIF